MDTGPALLERFATWADATHHTRFWGVAMLGTGQSCLTLPTRSDRFRAVLIQDGTAIRLVMGWATDSGRFDQARIAAIDDDPEDVLHTVAETVCQIGRQHLDADPDYAIQAASIAVDIGTRLECEIGSIIGHDLIDEAILAGGEL